MQLIEQLKENSTFQHCMQGARFAYAYVQTTLWPVYSTGMILSALCIIAAAQEKQMMADYLYGSRSTLQDDADAIVRRSTQMFDDETAHAVKQDVYSLTNAEFAAEYTPSASVAVSRK